MKTSQACVDFIKRMEGFLKYPIWDYAQYSVGYGTRCEKGDYPNGITEEEAERLLRKALKHFEAGINAIGRAFTQQQFDALVSFSYNVGLGWTATPNYLIYQLAHGAAYSEAEVLDIFGAWNKAGGNVLDGLTRRRRAEARMWLYGENSCAVENSEGKEEAEMRYQKIEELPEHYRKEIQELVDAGALRGADGKLDLSEDMVRTMIVSKRYADKLQADAVDEAVKAAIKRLIDKI